MSIVADGCVPLGDDGLPSNGLNLHFIVLGYLCTLLTPRLRLEFKVPSTVVGSSNFNRTKKKDSSYSKKIVRNQ